MKIAIYYPWVYLTSGVERVILEIVKRSKHDYTIFTNHFDKKNTYKEFQKLKVVKLKKIPVERDIFSVAKAAVKIAFQKIDLSDFDVLFVHCDGLGDLILTRNSKIPVFCYCHTPLRPVFDPYYRKIVLKKYKGIVRFLFYSFSELFKFFDRKFWSRYSYVFFNSNETLLRAEKGGLLEDLEGRYEVLHPGIDFKTHKPSWVYKPYFLIAGRIMWTKNIELGIRAFIKFKKEYSEHSDFKLIIAGQVDKKSKPHIQFLRKIAKGRQDIKFIISPTEVQLRGLYSECWSVLLTSFNEDWGMTLLEGNAYGKPSIAVNRGGPKESQIDGETGYLVGLSVEKLVKAMARLAKNKKLIIKMGKDARKNAEKFDWVEFIDRMDRRLE